jgi:hypothetical protein
VGLVFCHQLSSLTVDHSLLPGSDCDAGECARTDAPRPTIPLSFSAAVASELVRHAGRYVSCTLCAPLFHRLPCARCLQLWSQDNTLAPALELAKKFLVPCDVLGALWPCDTQTHKVGELRKRLDQACAVSGVPLPLSPVHALAPVLRARPADAFGAF